MRLPLHRPPVPQVQKTPPSLTPQSRSKVRAAMPLRTRRQGTGKREPPPRRTRQAHPPLRATVKMAKPRRIAAVGVTTVADTAASGTSKWKVKRGKWKVIPRSHAATKNRGMATRRIVFQRLQHLHQRPPHRLQGECRARLSCRKARQSRSGCRARTDRANRPFLDEHGDKAGCMTDRPWESSP